MKGFTLAFLSFLLIISHRYLTTCSGYAGSGVGARRMRAGQGPAHLVNPAASERHALCLHVHKGRALKALH